MIFYFFTKRIAAMVFFAAVFSPLAEATDLPEKTLTVSTANDLAHKVESAAMGTTILLKTVPTS